METKGKIQRVKKRLCELLCGSCFQASPGHPMVTEHREFRLETFPYDGYDIEIKVHPDHGIQLSAYLKGRLCLSGWFYSANDWAWAPLSESYADHIPNYQVRLYLQRYALKRLKKE